MTTKEIQAAICKAELLKGNDVCENLNSCFRGECDVLIVNKSRYFHEYEVKISRSDFLADRKKGKWKNMMGSDYLIGLTPNYFSYVCVEGLIKESDLWDSRFGLYWMVDGKIICVKKAKFLHKVKLDYEKIILKMLRTVSFSKYFGCQLLTLKNRETEERHNNLMELE